MNKHFDEIYKKLDDIWRARVADLQRRVEELEAERRRPDA